jgi:hypothetical protein
MYYRALQYYQDILQSTAVPAEGTTEPCTK